MKSINLSSRISEQMKSEVEEINTLEQGITKALLEKYKPRALCNIETLSNRKVQKRVA